MGCCGAIAHFAVVDQRNYFGFVDCFGGRFLGLADFYVGVSDDFILQVLSNYANDYGDGIRGTDAERIGEKRAVASGEITAKQMKNAVILFSFLSAISAISLVCISFG